MKITFELTNRSTCDVANAFIEQYDNEFKNAVTVFKGPEAQFISRCSLSVNNSDLVSKLISNASTRIQKVGHRIGK